MRVDGQLLFHTHTAHSLKIHKLGLGKHKTKVDSSICELFRCLSSVWVCLCASNVCVDNKWIHLGGLGMFVGSLHGHCSIIWNCYS